MDSVELEYGGKSLKLDKSKSMVGLRARKGRERELAPLAARLGVRKTDKALGGFSMVDAGNPPQPLEETLDTLRGTDEVEVGTHVYHTSDDKVPFVPTGNIYIVFHPEAAAAARDALLEQLALEVRERRGDHALIARVTPQSPNPVKAAVALQASGLVKIAEPDLASPGRLEGFVLPTDHMLPKQWHLKNTGMIDGSGDHLKAGADARVVAAWQAAATLGDPNVVVALIDDGFDLTHHEFSGANKIVAPWCFQRNAADPSPAAADMHGTACAGVAIGNADGMGITGAAPGCGFMPLRWTASMAGSQVEQWFHYAQSNGAAVISCSWSPQAKIQALDTLTREAIQACATQGRGGQGCVIVFAAGNQNWDINDAGGASLNGFATHPDVITVAASTSVDTRAHYSNYGADIDICAPSGGLGGRNILTTDIAGAGGFTFGDYAAGFDGTSSSSPLVAGICALMLSVCPQLTAAEVKQILQTTARKIGNPQDYDARGHSPYFGFGCVDAEQAIRHVLALSKCAASAPADTATPQPPEEPSEPSDTLKS